MKSFEIIKTVFFILSAIGAFYGFIYSQVFKNKPTFKTLKKLLKTNQPLQTYHNIINGILNKTNQFFGKSFSFKSFDRILLIAFVYPILFFLVCYLVSGNNLIGIFEIFPEKASIILRVFTVCVLAIYSIFVVLVFKNLDNIQYYILKKFNIKNKFIRGFIAVVVSVVVSVVVGGIGIGIGFSFVIVVVGFVGGVDFVIFSVAVVSSFVVGGVVGGVACLVGVVVVGGVVGGNVSAMTILLFFFLILPIANSIF